MEGVTLTESQSASVALTVEQAQALEVLGQKLASSATWWGDDDQTPPKSVIDVSRDPNGNWAVLVREAVGVISVDDLQLVVQPKIKLDHFLYLACESGVVPRIEKQPTQIDPLKSLWEVFAHWFVYATEAVVRGELAKGYREATDELELSRGRILALETGRAFYEGRPVIACEFEEFSADIALNRLLKAGCDMVASSAVLERDLRRKARAALARMTEVGALKFSDFRAEVDRLTHRYEEAVAFAKVLLRGGGTKISHGGTRGWCFLIRTPELVEAGIREILKRHLGARWQVAKKPKAISGAGMTLNPDLVFGQGLAVGDVKYKLLETQWGRADLYQAVAFAAGFESQNVIVVGFRDEGGIPLPPAVRFGPIEVQALAWDAMEGSDPEQSGEYLSNKVRDFLEASLRRNQGYRVR